MKIEDDLQAIRKALKYLNHETFRKEALEAEAALARIEQLLMKSADGAVSLR